MAEPNNEYFRREAAEAERRAQIAKSESDREVWMRIARDWLSLIKPELESNSEGLTIEFMLPITKMPVKH
jgi:hypothetical protein